MADFLGIKDAVAKVVGGNQPDATNKPRWFSGDTVGDSSGLQPGAGYPTFKGCYSIVPDSAPDTPFGVVVDGHFEVRGGGRDPDAYIQGEELNIDDLRLLILVAQQDSETTLTESSPYRDLVPTAFAAHMDLLQAPNVTQAMVKNGKPITTIIAGTPFVGLEFTIRVMRIINRTYQALSTP